MCAPAKSVCIWCVVAGAPNRTSVAVRRGVETSVVRRRERKAGFAVCQLVILSRQCAPFMFKHTTIDPLMPLSALLGAAFFFSPPFNFLMFSAPVLVLVPLVGGRHTATNAICSTARGSKVLRSAGTGSATKS